jgi:hypothetical protein
MTTRQPSRLLWAGLAAELLMLAGLMLFAATPADAGLAGPDKFHSESYKVRIATAAVLAESDDPRADARLAALTEDEHPLVRKVATRLRTHRD